MKRWKKRALAVLACTTGMASPAMAQTPFIGDIIIVPYNFCPAGYFEADGRLLSISEYDTLFALYGTTYGGDGVTTFALPDLRGRFSIHQGQGAGLSNYVIGEASGAETRTLTVNNLPAHTHVASLRASATEGDSTSPVNGWPALTAGLVYHTSTGANFMHSGTVEVGAAGGSQPIDSMAPFLTLRRCVAMFGIFPSQN